MNAFTATAYSRDLGDELRLLRESSSPLNGRHFALKLGWDPSKVSNIEHGKARASEIDLVQFLTACGKDIDFINEFHGRYHNAFDPYLAQKPSNLRTLAMTETIATKITSYEVMVAPGLLQTEKYAEALLTEGGLEAQEDIERYVEARIQRQTILRRQYRPECMFFVHELALQTRFGDAQLMEDQYLRLLFNTHVLRVVPAHVRSAALQSKCTLYEFEKAAPIVYTETDLAQVFAQDSVAVERSRKLFERLDAVALDAEQSRTKLMEYISALREDFDAPGPDLA